MRKGVQDLEICKVDLRRRLSLMVVRAAVEMAEKVVEKVLLFEWNLAINQVWWQSQPIPSNPSMFGEREKRPIPIVRRA